MAHENEAGKGLGRMWRGIMWGTIAVLLLVPALAMRVTPEVNWTASDFVFAAVLLGSVGLVVEFTTRMTKDWSYRGAVFIAILITFFTIWANGAVGIIGNENNPLNLYFHYLLLGGGLAAALARFKAKPMSWISTAIGIGQFVIAGIAAANGYWIWIFAAVSAALWSAAAVLFDRSVAKGGG